MERFQQTGKIDTDYHIWGLSDGAIPTIIQLDREHPELGLREMLTYRLTELQSEWEREWPSFNWSSYRARQELERYLK